MFNKSFKFNYVKRNKKKCYCIYLIFKVSLLIILFIIILLIMKNWGLGIGDWGLGIGPNPQSPIPRIY